MTLTNVARFRLENGDKAQLEAEAKERGMSLSDYLREKSGLKPLGPFPKAKEKDEKTFSDCAVCDTNEYAGSRTCPEHPNGPSFPKAPEKVQNDG